MSRYTDINWQPAPPAGFGSAPLILPRRTAFGWTGHVSVRTLKPAAGNVYYVDGVLGNDANAGTNPALPVQRIWVAMQKAGANLGTLKIAPGIYSYYEGWRDPSAVGALDPDTGHYSAEKWPIRPGPVIITSAAQYVPPLTWTQEAGPNDACWTYDLSLIAGGVNTITQVVDLSVLTPDGAPWTYPLVASKAATQAAPGSWSVVNGAGGEPTLVTIHTLNGEAPGRHILCLQTHTAASDLSRRTVYIDGLDFIGGGSGFIRDNNSGIAGGRLLARNCRAFSSYINGFQANGLNYSIMERCSAIGNRGDGMVYNESAGLGTLGAEINCKWIDNNGVSVAGIINETINGSTAHASSRIARYGCIAERNSGPNFADTNGCLSWFVGCSAGAALTHITSAQNAGFQFTNAGTEAWLYDCSASGSLHDLYVGGCDVHLDRCQFGTITNSGGTVDNAYVQV